MIPVSVEPRITTGVDRPSFRGRKPIVGSVSPDSPNPVFGDVARYQAFSAFCNRGTMLGSRSPTPLGTADPPIAACQAVRETATSTPGGLGLRGLNNGINAPKEKKAKP